MQQKEITTTLHGVLRSYSQIFFSENYWFAIPLILVSFFDVSAGFCGLLSVLTANIAARLLKYDRFTAIRGFYGFNSLLVGLGLGYFYDLTLLVIFLSVFSGFLALLITMAMQGILGKYFLPYLSIPFVLCIWIVLSTGNMLSGTIDNQSGVYILNKLFSIGGQPLVNLHQWWVTNINSNLLNSYFLSLGAIFFQFNVFAGMVIALSLLFYSRIAFILSILGFSVAFMAYSFMGIDITNLGYSYIGYNFILGAIAIGGVFYIPSRQSFFWALAITPVIAIVASGLFGLLKPFNLTILSLPFNLVFLTFLYAMRFRTTQSKFKEVLIQEGTPERNLYAYQSYVTRFPDFGLLRIKLPFFGEWYVSQGHNGDITHKGEWAEAWDFVIYDSDSVQFKGTGNNLKDYYCFGQNVLAPADGSVVVVEDEIADNNIGEVNTIKNWGNTIIIKHSDSLYSKLSHLQKGSVRVRTGESVQSGQVIGKVGNSGRSPFPHLHFQLQATPSIGSKTIRYPLFAYLENGSEIKTFSFPLKGQKVKSIEENPLLKKAFNLMPGTKLNWKMISLNREEIVSWEVFTNVYNIPYIYCHSTRSVANFQFDGVNFCFTRFEGDRRSLLYAFYLAAFRIPIVYIDGYILNDSLPVNHTFNGWRLFFQDFIATFYLYLKTGFRVEMRKNGSDFELESIEYISNVTGCSFKKPIWRKDFRLSVNKDCSLILADQNSESVSICEPY
jgi:urea transporter